MDNNIVGQQNSNDIQVKQGYQTLGKKVFWLFFLQISPAAFIVLILFLFFLIVSFQPFLANTIYGNLQKYSLTASLVSFLLFVMIAGISFAYSWLTYINFTFCMADDSFKIKRGIINKTEDAIPYKQIQDVDVERGLLFLILGLSRLVILTAGHEDERDNEGDESEGVIPAVDKKLAEWLQAELLRRADIQKTVAVNSTQPPQIPKQPAQY
jgi:putative membrane protein